MLQPLFNFTLCYDHPCSVVSVMKNARNMKKGVMVPDESRWKPEPNTVYTYINSDKLYELSCITIFSRIKIRLSDISDIFALIKEQNKEGNTIHFLQSPRNILQYNGLEFCWLWGRPCKEEKEKKSIYPAD